MDKIVKYLVILCSILSCKGSQFWQEVEDMFGMHNANDGNQIPSEIRAYIEHDEKKTSSDTRGHSNEIAGHFETPSEMLGPSIGNDGNAIPPEMMGPSMGKDGYPLRRSLDLNNVGHILGSPSMASHLPEAEPILPGHTLIRPALGMLKSAIKFPHRELENGAGVYGSVNNLGIRYDGRNERVLYSGFRRSPADYIMVAPVKSDSSQPKFVVSSVVLDLDKDNVYRQLLRNIKKTRNEKNKRIINLFEEPEYKRNRQKLGFKKSHQRPEYTLRNLFIYGNADKSSPKRLLQIGKKKSLRVNYNYDDDDDDVSLDDNFPVQEIFDNAAKDVSKSEEKEKNTPKNKWFWASKNSFSHIKVPQDAPNFIELMPANVTDNIRSWWFYHQDDYQPFQSISLKENTDPQ